MATTFLAWGHRLAGTSLGVLFCSRDIFLRSRGFDETPATRTVKRGIVTTLSGTRGSPYSGTELQRYEITRPVSGRRTIGEAGTEVTADVVGCERGDRRIAGDIAERHLTDLEGPDAPGPGANQNPSSFFRPTRRRENHDDVGVVALA